MRRVKVAGIDLAARPHRPTGIAVIDGERIHAETLRSDEEILGYLREEEPLVVAVDAPLLLSEERYAERYLRRYGALPLTMPTMKALARRAVSLAGRISGPRVIEVFPTATAKILGFYRRPKRDMLPHFSASFRVEGGGNAHEVDAIIAAYTGLLYLKGKTINVGGVVIPLTEGRAPPSGTPRAPRTL